MVHVIPKPNFKLQITFKDGFKKTVNINSFISKGISKKLKDKQYFQKVSIDPLGGIFWPNGFDFCPNYLREIAEGKN